MTTFFDSSVVIPLLDPDHSFHAACRNAYEEAALNNPPLAISDMVYCEVSMGYDVKSHADEALSAFSFERVSYADDVLFRAGQAFLSYKKNGGQTKTVLPDFFIGALAELDGSPLVTRDDAKIKSYFPSVARINPK